MAESPTELHTEIEKLEARHAEHPEGRYFVPLANAYRKLGDLEHAEELLREGLHHHPDYLSAHIVLGRCLADRGATPEAASEFQYVLSIDPQNLIALRTLGELEVAGGRPAEAARWYEQLLSVDPMNEEARRALETLPTGGDTRLDASLDVGGGWWDTPGSPSEAEAEAPSQTTSQPEPATEPLPPRPSFAPSQREPDRSASASAYDIDGDELGLDAGAEVVTETIAELYARQGLHDRAADVYRELIRRRGGDPSLERRLAELEVVAAGGPLPEPTVSASADAALEPEPAPPAEQEPDPAFQAHGDYGNLEPDPLPSLEWTSSDASGADDLPLSDEDPFAASFSYGFAAEPVPAAPFEETEPEAEASPVVTAPPAGPTIAMYLADLVAWKPGSGRAEERPAAAAQEPNLSATAPTEAPEEQDDVWEFGPGVGDLISENLRDSGFTGRIDLLDQPEGTQADTLSLTDGPEGDDLWEFGPGVGDIETSDLRESEPPSTGEILIEGFEPPLAETGGSVLFPWETGETNESAERAAELSTSVDGDFELESFFSDEPSPEAGRSEEPIQATAPVAPATPAQPPAPAPAAAPEDDDDLESFQAWLRSLKR